MRAVRKRLSDKVTFEQRLQGRERIYHLGFWGTIWISGGRPSQPWGLVSAKALRQEYPWHVDGTVRRSLRVEWNRRRGVGVEAGEFNRGPNPLGLCGVVGGLWVLFCVRQEAIDQSDASSDIIRFGFEKSPCNHCTENRLEEGGK